MYRDSQVVVVPAYGNVSKLHKWDRMGQNLQKSRTREAREPNRSHKNQSTRLDNGQVLPDVH